MSDGESRTEVWRERSDFGIEVAPVIQSIHMPSLP